MLHFNGIDGATGRPLLAPMSAEELVPRIEGAGRLEIPSVVGMLSTTREKRILARVRGTLGVIEGVDPLRLEEARWGIIYHPEIEPAVREALSDLVAARLGQLGDPKLRPQATEFKYLPDESSWHFRSRHHQAHGAVNPETLPYYLLIVGSPQQIPYRFQYGLGAQHAVGRLYFEQADDYRRYAERLLAYESAEAPFSRVRQVSFFSPENPQDEATATSASWLAAPLAHALDGKPLKMSGGDIVQYRSHRLTGDQATKPALLNLLARSKGAPAVVFSASHGLGFPAGHPRQRASQGALLCQEWPGPSAWPLDTEIPGTMYMSGYDLPPDARCDGLFFFAFACYSAGTPRLDDFSHLQHDSPRELAGKPFVARLPERLLALGALAFIGHVDRAWDFSFLGVDGASSVGTYQSTLEAILKGKPVGHALEYFGDRYADLAHEITDSHEDSLLHKFNLREPVEPVDLARLWTAHNDARAYVLFGDPFARLRPSLMSAPGDMGEK